MLTSKTLFFISTFTQSVRSGSVSGVELSPQDFIQHYQSIYSDYNSIALDTKDNWRISTVTNMASDFNLTEIAMLSREATYLVPASSSHKKTSETRKATYLLEQSSEEIRVKIKEIQDSWAESQMKFLEILPKSFITFLEEFLPQLKALCPDNWSDNIPQERVSSEIIENLEIESFQLGLMDLLNGVVEMSDFARVVGVALLRGIAGEFKMHFNGGSDPESIMVISRFRSALKWVRTVKNMAHEQKKKVSLQDIQKYLKVFLTMFNKLFTCDIDMTLTVSVGETEADVDKVEMTDPVSEDEIVGSGTNSFATGDDNERDEFIAMKNALILQSILVGVEFILIVCVSVVIFRRGRLHTRFDA